MKEYIVHSPEGNPLAVEEYTSFYGEPIQELIRCKDCKHRIDDFCMSFARYGIKENGFCDKAKRRDDE